MLRKLGSVFIVRLAVAILICLSTFPIRPAEGLPNGGIAWAEKPSAELAGQEDEQAAKTQAWPDVSSATRDENNPAETLAGGPVPPYVNIHVTLESDADAQYLGTIRQAIERYGWTAAFYVTPEFASRHPQEVKNLIVKGHELGVLVGGDLNSPGFDDVTKLVGQALSSVRQSLGLAKDYSLHLRFQNYVVNYGEAMGKLRALESLGVPTITGVFPVSNDFFCSYSAQNTRLMYPLPAESAKKVIMIPVATAGGPGQAVSGQYSGGQSRVASRESSIGQWDETLVPLDDSYPQGGKSALSAQGTSAGPVDVFASATGKYNAFVQPGEGESKVAQSEPQAYVHDKFLTIILHPSVTGADPTALASFNGFLDRVNAKSGATTTNGQIVEITGRVLAAGYITSLSIAADTPAATAGSNVGLTINYGSSLYCPHFYFRVYGKYPSQGDWQLLGQYDFYVNTGSHSFNSYSDVPEPPSDADTTYKYLVVGQSCKGGGCSWPTPQSYERKADTQIDILKIKKITVTPEEPVTDDTAELKVEVNNASYTPKKVKWTIEPIGTRKTMVEGGARKAIPKKEEEKDGDTYDYEPDLNTHGEKRITAKATWEINGKSYSHEKTKDFKLFFVKIGDDDGDSDPNWFDYWRDDKTVPSLDGSDVEYDACQGPDSWGYYDPADDKVHIGGASSKIHYNPAVVINGTSFGGPSVKGIDTATEVVLHKLAHKSVNHNWRAGGIWVGKTDTDRGLEAANHNDQLPDDFETSTNGTSITRTDTYNVAAAKGNPDYSLYGDQEYYVMMLANGKKGTVANDWANPGKQTKSPYLPSGIEQDSVPPSASGPATKITPLGSGQPRRDFATLAGSYSSQAVDNSGDGKYERLDISARVVITIAGSYDLVGWLTDSEAQLSAGRAHRPGWPLVPTR